MSAPTAVPVLMYHSVAESPPSTTHALSVHPARFRAQVAHLAAAGYTGMTFAGLVEALRGRGTLPARPVVITFDDGYADLHSEALPVLAEHAFPATVFVTTGWLDDAGDDSAGRPLDRMLAWGQVRELAAAGVEIAAHSHSHPQLDQLGERRLRDELRRSKHLLEDRLGAGVPSMAYPFGYHSARVRDAVRDAGYAQAAAVGNAVASRAAAFAVPRLTVRRTTSPGAFVRVAAGRGVPATYGLERTLTWGWSWVRRARYPVSTRRRG